MTVFSTRISPLALACGLFSTCAMAQDPTLTNPAISAVLDGYYQTADRPMAERQEGFGLGKPNWRSAPILTICFMANSPPP